MLDSSDIYLPEGGVSWTSECLEDFFFELDKAINCADVWSTITRTGGLISLVEYFSDAAKTKKMAEKTFTYNLQNKLVEIKTVKVNQDGTEDSRVTETIVRNSQGLVTGCESVFSTTESFHTC